MEKQTWDIHDVWDNYRALFIAFGLLFLTFCAFNTILENDFISFDDPMYVTGNSFVQQGLTPSSIRWAFTTFEMANWHPLTWLSHMLDVELYGLRPGGHHLTSLLIHLCNVILLFGWLRYTTGSVWRSALAAALFAVHPLRTESVAWVAERKDVLSCCFGLLSLWAYVFYVHKPCFQRYLWVFVFMLLSLMSKAMLVTLPVLLLLLDRWPLKRSGNFGVVGIHSVLRPQMLLRNSLLKEKIPLVILSMVFCVITIVSQKAGESVESLKVLSLSVRLANMFTSYIQYIGKIFYPVHLALFYPYHSIWLVWAFFCLMVFAAITLIVTVRSSRYPCLFVGWWWFVVSLLPVIGLIQIGRQALADRYTYIPSIGFLVGIAWLAGEFSKRGVTARRIAISVSVVFLIWLLGMTWRQSYYWKDSLTLFQRTLEITEDNFVTEQHYAIALEKAGRLDMAEKHAVYAIQLTPPRWDLYILLGNIYFKKNQLDDAEIYLQKALHLGTDSAAETCYYLALVYFQQKKYDKAREYLKRAEESNVNRIAIWYVLADVYQEQSQLNLAFETWRKILTLDSTQNEAMTCLAWNMATCADPNAADPSAALQYAVQAAEQTDYESASVLDVLAAAYARAGDFDRAVNTADKAIQIAEKKSLHDLIADIQKRKQCYEDKKPWIEKSRHKGDL